MTDKNSNKPKAIIYDSQKYPDPLGNFIEINNRFDRTANFYGVDNLSGRYIYANNYIGVAKSRVSELRNLLQIINTEIVEWEKVISLCESTISNLKEYYDDDHDGDESNYDDDDESNYDDDDFDTGNYDRDGNPNI